MRVISGIARGLKLNSPVNDDVRPTTDRVKESMFNIIASRIYDSSVLDLFSGSGALGIECISRGSKYVYFCDNNENSIKVIKSNLEKARFYDNYEIMKDDFRNIIKILSNKNEKFDIIFVDPPYYEGLFDEVISMIINKKILEDDGLIVVEHDSNIIMKEYDGIYKIKEKKYGMTKLTFYSLEENYE
ncbi:16S rRNA (guanine(966)-N(2))-methyltransferase RsmD [Peptostreptococcus canis]|uniref:16S rRNA (Guanine(966)-N(2))-methyltransferase RsmD n=1 Tax=Peptostreptococcus canis TaxID=1159213 RepID=A0ABR6TKI5_9FIRM|nr:16S rRNA (guanine(966)-N(2))-methyltransferase RsmD [Peptostreptococcus canis]MBC2575658.1 16S rRNA (guanine(966)-N(2))-methyltransferase RsmD [Peptostreptococcus canis]MBP1997137.1 16S rRNA (guanine(966)-N(2))-methyltransferase RsmD [Peptostreptococcus canis]